MTRISPKEAYEKLREGYTYVDVREPDEFAEGHPAGAVSLPISRADFVQAMEREFTRNAKIITGCAAGGRSLRAARMLEQAGFTNVLDQRAGWKGTVDPFGRIVEPGWSRCDLPVETGPGRSL